MTDNEETTIEAPTESTIKLWNPAAVNGWALMFTPIFSAWLHAKNWEELDQPERAKNSKVWFYVLLLIILGSFFIPDAKAGGLVIVLALLYYFLSGRKQTQYVKANNIEYEKKPWTKPILLGLMIPLIFVTVLGLSWKGIEKASNNNIIEATSVDLVTQIIEKEFESDIKCKAVHIEKEISDGFYHAVAYLDNGNELKISIERKGDQIQVAIPEQ